METFTWNIGEMGILDLPDFNRFNVYLPIGYSRTQFQYWSTGPSIYLGGRQGTGLTPAGDKNGRLQQNSSGITKIYDITISTNAESAIKIIATKRQN